jgi:hypothetical protein
MTNRLIVRTTAGLAALLVAVFGTLGVAKAETPEIPQAKLDIIQQRCTSSQFSLQQIEKREAVSRINRGRAYDQMMRQISAMNSRFAYNKISSPDLIQLSSDLQTAVDKFRANYDHYDSDLTDAMRLDCKAKPADYYNLITQARDDRGSVGSQVDAINDLMQKYRDALLKYKDTVQ